MGALPIPEPYPHALYIEELHQFYLAKGLCYGSPVDLTALVERLDDPGLFHEDMRALVRTIVAREQGAISRSDLLAMLAVSISGPLVYRSAQQLRQPLNRLLAFVDGVLRKSPVQPGTASNGPSLVPRGDVLQFPSAAVPEQPAPAASQPLETPVGRSRLRALRPAAPSPSFRTAMLVAGGALLLVVLLALLLHPSRGSSRATTTSPARYSNLKPSANADGFFGSLTSFLHSQEPASMRGTTVVVAPAANSSITSFSSVDAPPAEMTGRPQPPAAQRTTTPSATSLRLAPEFSQPAPEGVVPASAVNAAPSGVVPAWSPTIRSTR